MAAVNLTLKWNWIWLYCEIVSFLFLLHHQPLISPPSTRTPELKCIRFLSAMCSSINEHIFLFFFSRIHSQISPSDINVTDSTGRGSPLLNFFPTTSSHLEISWCSQVNCRRMDEWPKLDGCCCCWLLSSLVGDFSVSCYTAAAAAAAELHPPLPVSLHRGRSPAACERMNAKAWDFTIAKRTPCLSW